MWKKTFLALAVAATFVGAGAFFAPTPADAQPMYRHQPHQWGGGYAQPRYYGDPPRNHWRHHQPRWGYRSGWVAPPGVATYGYGYGSYGECRTVMKRSRVWTDDGWRRIWRRVRVCD